MARISSVQPTYSQLIYELEPERYREELSLGGSCEGHVYNISSFAACAFQYEGEQ